MRVNVGYHIHGAASVAVERNGISAYFMVTRAYEYHYDEPGRLSGHRYSLTMPRICDEDIRTTGGD